MRAWALVAVLIMLLAACSSGEDVSSIEYANFNGGSTSDSDVVNVADGNQLAQPITERIILRSASLSLVVDDPRDSLENIIQLTAEIGGWVVNSTARTGDNATVSVQIRVPAEQLDEVLASIKAEARDVLSEVITGQDVTQEYTDLNSRLDNLEAAETQLQSIMDTAEDTQSVLAIYNELVRIRGEIETIRGRINFFEQSADFATIAVELRSEQENTIADTEWNPGDTVESAITLLGGLLRLLADAIIFVVIVGIPLLIMFGFPYRLYRRFVGSLFMKSPTTRATETKDSND